MHSLSKAVTCIQFFVLSSFVMAVIWQTISMVSLVFLKFFVKQAQLLVAIYNTKLAVALTITTVLRKFILLFLAKGTLSEDTICLFLKQIGKKTIIVIPNET